MTPGMSGEAWDAIHAYDVKPLRALFEADDRRLESLSFDVAGMTFDFSKTHLDRELLAQFGKLAEAQGFSAAREALFAGETVNSTEGRPAEHVAERGTGSAGDM